LALPVSSGSVNGPAHSLYPGCAYCHQVQGAVEGRPQITPPVQIGRWLAHGRFDHNRHTTISCAKCHPAASSSETADVLLTSKKVCAECHSPQGGVADSCVTCHHYHNTPPGGASPLKTATSAGNFPRSD
jgi:predicted CXXCH cytochrome family protein